MFWISILIEYGLSLKKLNGAKIKRNIDY